VDKLTIEHRSANMRQIRSKDTAPELLLRTLAHSLGYRFRLHRKDLPGKPDLVFPARRKIIFLHGCFWHQHSECREGRLPGTRREYWEPKLSKNLQRDAAARAALEAQGWQVMIVWECELLKDRQSVREGLVKFLGPAARSCKERDRSGKC
jgi:DNA mismatch endonuclease (patch repair protein)